MKDNTRLSNFTLMPNHIQVTFTDLQPEQQDVLIAHLADAGYEGFEETEKILKAFITEENYDKVILNELAFKYQLVFSAQRIEEQNWNTLWESNFPTVIVEDFVGIRAGFHDPIKNVKHEIIITPKMSFGTGHHATTFMMIQQMEEINFAGKKIFDFGTGTGVLAILAEKLGATEIKAVDNDDWSISNASENITTNNCTKIKLELAESMSEGETYDIILANINKNVILVHLQQLSRQLAPGGTILLSGLLEADEPDILSPAKGLSLSLVKKASKSGWIALRLSR
jgi:ribosomal protein L11 methyltransferase